MEAAPLFFCLFIECQRITNHNPRKPTCQLPCFFMRLGRRTFLQHHNIQRFTKITACQLVLKFSGKVKNRFRDHLICISNIKYFSGTIAFACRILKK